MSDPRPESDPLGAWDRLLCRWVPWVERHAITVLLVLLAITAVAGWHAWRNFAIDSDVSRLIDPDPGLRWVIDDDRFKAEFPQLVDTAVMVVSGPDRRAVVRHADALAERLRTDERFSDVFAPAAHPFWNDKRLYLLPEADFEPTLASLEAAMPLLARTAQQPALDTVLTTLAGAAGQGGPALGDFADRIAASAESVAAGGDGRLELVADGGEGTHYALVILRGEPVFGEAQPNRVLVEAMRAAVDDTPTPESVQVRLTGEVMLAHEEIVAGQEGIALAGTVSVILLTVLLIFGVRSFRVVVAILTLLGVGITWTLAFALLAVGSFNTLSLMFLVMFFGLGVDFAIHYTLRVQEARARPDEQGQPLLAATRHAGGAISLCTLTSAIAFAAFIPTDYTGLAELGVISAGGMAIALVLTFTWIPAMFGALGLPSALRQRWISGGDYALRLELQHRVAILGGVAVLAVFAAWYAADLEFDFSVLALRDPDSEGMATLLELQREEVITDYAISVLADDTAAAEALADELAGLDTVARVQTPADLVPSGQDERAERLATSASRWQAVRQATPAPESARDPAAAVAAFLAATDEDAFPRLRSSLMELTADPAGLERLEDDLAGDLATIGTDLGDWLAAMPFTFADLPARFRDDWVSEAGTRRVGAVSALDVTDAGELDRFVREVYAVAPAAAGRPVVEWGVGQTVVEAFRTAVIGALVAIAVILLLTLRSIGYPLLVLVPLVLAALFTFAAASIAGLSINMANILVIPLIFGLGVDTGIHVVHRFRSEPDVEHALHSSTPRAVVLSALTTIGTFASLSLSPHVGAASVGQLLTVAISLLLVFALLVLPVLLVTFYGQQQRGGAS